MPSEHVADRAARARLRRSHAQTGPSAPGLGHCRRTTTDERPARSALIIGVAVAGLLLVAVARHRDPQCRGRQPAHGCGGRGRWSRRAEGTVDTTMRLRLKHAVDQARDMLARAGGAPGDAVVAAWLTLENATEHRAGAAPDGHRVHRRAAGTETADETRCVELRALYQRARFGRPAAPRSDARPPLAAALDRILRHDPMSAPDAPDARDPARGRRGGRGLARSSPSSVPIDWAVLHRAARRRARASRRGLLAGTFDADWTAEPEPPAASVTLHATFLTERLERCRHRPVPLHLPRPAAAAPHRGRAPRSGTDLNTRGPREGERWAPTCTALLTAPDAQLPTAEDDSPRSMRRLEDTVDVDTDHYRHPRRGRPPCWPPSARSSSAGTGRCGSRSRRCSPAGTCCSRTCRGSARR